MTFDDVLEQALEMLRRRGRVSYRALKVQFQLDDDVLALLRDEIVEVHQLARDQEGTILVWTGDPATGAPRLPPHQTLQDTAGEVMGRHAFIHTLQRGPQRGKDASALVASPPTRRQRAPDLWPSQ